MQLVSVNFDNLVLESNRDPTESHKSGDKHDELRPGTKVKLYGLEPTSTTYKRSHWLNQASLNGSTGKILRKEGHHWIVELDSDMSVRSQAIDSRHLHTKE